MSDRAFFRAFYHSLLDDDDFQKLSPEARWLFVCCRTSRVCNIASIYLCDEGTFVTLSAETGFNIEKVKDIIFGELSDAKWVIYERPILWLKNGLKYDPFVKLNNEKHQVGVLNVLKSLPKREIIITFCDYYNLAYPFDRESIPHRYPSDTTKNKNRNNNKNNNKNNTLGDKSPSENHLGEIRIDYEAVQNAFNDICETLPKVKLLTPERKKRMRSIALKMEFTNDNYLPEYKKIFSLVNQSEFLSGRNGKWTNCSFDWVLKPANLIKILEGNYIERKEREKSEHYKQLNEEAIIALRNKIMSEE